MTSFLALRASVCVSFMVSNFLGIFVGYIGLRSPPPRHPLSLFSRIVRRPLGNEWLPVRAASGRSEGPGFESRLDPHVFCSHPSGLNFASMPPYEFSIWHPHASVWCSVRFSSRERFPELLFQSLPVAGVTVPGLLGIGIGIVQVARFRKLGRPTAGPRPPPGDIALDAAEVLSVFEAVSWDSRVCCS